MLNLKVNLKVNKKIYLAGHTGMVGSAIFRKLKAEGCNNFVLITIDQLDLRNQTEVEKFFNEEKPEIVIVAIAKVSRFLPNNTHCVNL